MTHVKAFRVVPAAVFGGLLALGSCLSGCVGPASCVDPEEQAVRDIVKCQQYGFAPGTYDYSMCRKQLDEGRESAVMASQSNK
jgi:hypothetical protein